MTTMISEVYDALRDAGASEDKARKAAEAVAVYENRLAGIETKIGRLTTATSILSIATIGILLSQFLLWQQVGKVSGSLGQFSSQLSHIEQMLTEKHG